MGLAFDLYEFCESVSLCSILVKAGAGTAATALVFLASLGRNRAFSLVLHAPLTGC